MGHSRVEMVGGPRGSKRGNVCTGIRRDGHELGLKVFELDLADQKQGLLCHGSLPTPSPAVRDGVNRERLEKGTEMPK